MRKRPRQRRSQEMVEAILAAAAEVFAQLGYARATTNKIAERAGVSVGSLYQYFPNKDSLLARLLAQHHQEVHRVIDAAILRLADPATPLEQGLRQLLSALMEVHQAKPDLTRALSAHILRQSPQAADLLAEEQDWDQSRAVVELLARRPDVRSGDHEAMAAILAQTTAQLTRWLVHDPPGGIDHGVLLEEVVQLLVRFLRA